MTGNVPNQEYLNMAVEYLAKTAIIEALKEQRTRARIKRPTRSNKFMRFIWLLV